jgi:hypothetical protein
MHRRWPRCTDRGRLTGAGVMSKQMMREFDELARGR